MYLETSDFCPLYSSTSTYLNFTRMIKTKTEVKNTLIFFLCSFRVEPNDTIKILRASVSNVPVFTTTSIHQCHQTTVIVILKPVTN